MEKDTRSIAQTDQAEPSAAQTELAARIAEQLAARITEQNVREAVARRVAEHDARDLRREAVESRAAELDERERALAAREQLIRSLEDRVDETRRRLDERLQKIKDRRAYAHAAPVPGFRSPSIELRLSSDFRVPSVNETYFGAGTNLDEDRWWSLQLGKNPSLAA
jgi:hypothetical protein